MFHKKSVNQAGVIKAEVSIKEGRAEGGKSKSCNFPKSNSASSTQSLSLFLLRCHGFDFRQASEPSPMEAIRVETVKNVYLVLYKLLPAYYGLSACRIAFLLPAGRDVGNPFQTLVFTFSW
ncbi:hypothetical protein TorRG33x02_190780 [Trema orientale]|uniref:Uncharacterized protein n=1 Tax=Trema orientale TaxID=63057 RepID=A0A2P5EHX7_TREOI|nr:hypothetical protein TorRG33x02_190780 [Trema orientale]